MIHALHVRTEKIFMLQTSILDLKLGKVTEIGTFSVKHAADSTGSCGLGTARRHCMSVYQGLQINYGLHNCHVQCSYWANNIEKNRPEEISDLPCYGQRTRDLH